MVPIFMASGLMQTLAHTNINAYNVLQKQDETITLDHGKVIPLHTCATTHQVGEITLADYLGSKWVYSGVLDDPAQTFKCWTFNMSNSSTNTMVCLYLFVFVLIVLYLFILYYICLYCIVFVLIVLYLFVLYYYLFVL